MPLGLLIIVALMMIYPFVVKKAKDGQKYEKRRKAGVIVFWGLVAFVICLLALNLYEAATVAYPAHYIDYEKSYITEVLCEGDTVHYTASLCVRNRRPNRTKMDRLELSVYGRDGNEEHRDLIVAEITSPSYEEAIVFLPFWSKRIECSFDITEFGAAFNMERIRNIETYKFFQ